MKSSFEVLEMIVIVWRNGENVSGTPGQRSIYTDAITQCDDFCQIQIACICCRWMSIRMEMATVIRHNFYCRYPPRSSCCSHRYRSYCVIAALMAFKVIFELWKKKWKTNRHTGSFNTFSRVSLLMHLGCFTFFEEKLQFRSILQIDSMDRLVFHICFCR